MNKKDTIIAEKNLLNKIKKSSLYSTREGCLKCWRGVTYDHFMTMCAVAWKIANSGWKVYSEVEFINGGRGDLVAINGETGFIIEILHTETEARFSSKKDTYPEEFNLISVKTENFDINEFDW